MDTLAQVREDVAAFVGPSGACAEDEVVVKAINNVRRIIYEIGDWEGTTEPLCIKPHCGTITLPAGYTHATKAHVSCVPVVVENDWFTHIGEFERSCGRPTNIIKQEGEYVTFQDWPCVPKKQCCDPKGFRLKVVFESEGDEGVTLKFWGRAVYQHEVMIQRTYSDSWINTPQSDAEPSLLSLTRVIKPKTKGRIRIYGFDGYAADPTNERLLAVYEPNWINPAFARYHVSRGMTSIVLKAKKRYTPLDSNDQFVDIHTDAIIHGLQAIRERNAGHLAEYNANLKMAVDFLNAQMGRKQATSTAPVQMSSAYRVEGLV